MALSTQAVESMLQAMSIISTSQLNTISYDKTIVCTIVDRSAASKQSYYMVTDGSTRFKAYVQNTQEAEEYDVDDQVYVKIPNGDFSKKNGKITCQRPFKILILSRILWRDGRVV